MKLFTTSIHTTQIKIITILIIGTGATQKAAQETWAIVKSGPLMENVAPNRFSMMIFHKTIVKEYISVCEKLKDGIKTIFGL